MGTLPTGTGAKFHSGGIRLESTLEIISCAELYANGCIGQAGLRVGRFARLASKPAGEQTGQNTYI